jgi:predicted aspartyl protease
MLSCSPFLCFLTIKFKPQMAKTEYRNSVQFNVHKISVTLNGRRYVSLQINAKNGNIIGTTLARISNKFPV